MHHYNHILLATDLSTECEQVALRAKDLAQRSEAKLSIVHVMEHPPVIYGGGEYTIPMDVNIEDTLRKEADSLLANLGQKLDVPVSRLHLQLGSAKREIIDLAKKLNVDLIVIGSHGRRGIQILLGSTAQGVLHTATCDVFSVRISNR